ncbi:MAG: hypothetical protein AAB776_01265 [Patescibacteria group bacterium]
MRLITRSFSVNSRDDGEGGSRLQFHNHGLAILESRGDLAITTVTNERNLLPGTILMNLDYKYNKTDKFWEPSRYPSLGNALLTLRAIIEEATKELNKLKRQPITPANELKRTVMSERRQRAVRLAKALLAQENELLKLFDADAPIKELQAQLGIRPYYSWLQLLIRYKTAGEVDYAERVRKAVTARHLFDCLRQGTTGQRDGDFVQRGLTAPLRLILDVYERDLGKWGSPRFAAALQILRSLVMSKPLTGTMANEELRLAVEAIDTGANEILTRLIS